MLETIPSYSTAKHNGLSEEEEDEEMESESEDGFSVVNGGKDVIFSEEVRVKNGVCRVSFGDQEEVGSGKEMYLAKGLGVECCGEWWKGCDIQ